MSIDISTGGFDRNEVLVFGKSGSDYTSLDVDTSGRITNKNQVYNADTMAYEAMKQPVLELTTSNLYLALDGVEAKLDFIKNHYSAKYDYDASGNIIYAGYCAMGSIASTGSAIWLIIKYTYDVSNNLTDKAFADGNISFDNIWDNRVSLTYS